VKFCGFGGIFAVLVKFAEFHRFCGILVFWWNFMDFGVLVKFYGFCRFREIRRISPILRIWWGFVDFQRYYLI